MADKKVDDGVIAGRKQMRLDNEAEAKKLGKHRRRIKERLKDGRDWPVQIVDGKAQRAAVDKDDVLAPLPDDLKVPLGNFDEKMHLLRQEAELHRDRTDGIVDVDPGVHQRRQRDRAEERAARNRVTGEVWTEDLVEARMLEAYKVLFRASVSGVGPRAFGNAMPQVVKTMSDMVHQAGNKSLRNAIAHRFRGVPSNDEMRRAEESLAWALTYLRDHEPDLAAFLNLGAMWRAWGAKIAHKCRDIGVQRQTFYRDRKAAIAIIVEGLKRGGRAPT